ncbi:hypothetical protein BC938DRAFT_472349 [Jimgerdemannia flammicorona]|uniref:CBS domain-containing protein n=1 Tax=Jimgerdemannia flammicorona TaxID=994334 RepID=A0A433Q6A8_9FUNG|nr:hypothetical protein BC938DRAFT_472349 [Jimgerdemannia flammicorona]
MRSGPSYIIAWPIAKILDMLLGADHGMIYRRAELKELIALHSEHHNAGGDLERDAVTILHGALAMQDKTVREAVTPIDKVFMLKHDEILNRKTLNKIHGSGHSRIPVFKMAEAENEGEAQEEKENMGEGVKENGVPGEAKAKAKIVERDGVDDKEILGVLLVKNLILLDPDDGIPLSHMKINKIPTVSPNMPLFDLLNAFQEGRSHMAVVREDDNLASTNASIRSLPPTRRTSVSSIRTSASIKSFKLRRFLGFRHDNDADSEGTKGSTAEQPMIMVTPAPDTDDGSPNKQKLATPEASLLAPTAATTTMSKVPSKLVGIITLEDVLEELIQEEIYDETDNKKLAALAVKLDAGTGDRYMVASHRLSIKSGHTGAFGTQKQEKHRRRFSEDTTKSLDETEGRKTAIRELREDDERIEIEKENQEKEARKKVVRSSSAGSMQVVAEIETEKDDGTLTDDETPQRSRSMRLQRSHTHPGVVSTGDEENEK